MNVSFMVLSFLFGFSDPNIDAQIFIRLADRRYFENGTAGMIETRDGRHTFFTFITFMGAGEMWSRAPS
jgi:hypothetical protein